MQSDTQAARKTISTLPLLVVIAPHGKVPADLQTFINKVKALAAPEHFEKFDVQAFPDFATFASYLTTGHIPHLLLIDHPEFAPEAKRPSQLKPVFQELRRNDPNISILMVCQKLPSGMDLMNWLDAGTTAFLERGESGANIDEALEELLGRRLNNQDRRKIRVARSHSIEIHIPSLHQAIVAETLNIGVGGMFLRTSAREMKLGDVIEFSFKLNASTSSSPSADAIQRPSFLDRLDDEPPGALPGLTPTATFIKGTGKIVWIRLEASSDMPEGVGIQFLELEADGQKLVDDFVKKQRTHAFIPKA